MNRSQPATLFLRPVTADDLIYDLHNNTKSSEYSKHTGQIWSHLPATTGYFIIRTGHCRRLYMRFTQLGWVPQNTLKIHGRVLWHLPATTGYFIIRTGHCRRLYMRFTQWGQVLQNILKIHGCVLWLLPVTTDYFIYVPYKNWGSVDRRRYLILRPRPCFAHRPDYSSVFPYGLGLT